MYDMKKIVLSLNPKVTCVTYEDGNMVFSISSLRNYRKSHK